MRISIEDAMASGGVMVRYAAKVDVSTWHARAAACELLSLSLSYPDHELTEVVSSGEWADAASEIWGALDCALPSGWASGVYETRLSSLRVEATRLFVGAPRPVCSPYEGFWRAGDDGVQPLMFVNPYSMDVERFCKACGWGRAQGPNEPLDHLATEFALLSYLASLEAGIVVLPEGFAACDLPEGGPSAAYKAFMDCHVRSFASRFAMLLEEESRITFYRAVAQMLTAFVD